MELPEQPQKGHFMSCHLDREEKSVPPFDGFTKASRKRWLWPFWNIPGKGVSRENAWSMERGVGNKLGIGGQ